MRVGGVSPELASAERWEPALQLDRRLPGLFPDGSREHESRILEAVRLVGRNQSDPLGCNRMDIIVERAAALGVQSGRSPRVWVLLAARTAGASSCVFRNVPRRAARVASVAAGGRRHAGRDGGDLVLLAGRAGGKRRATHHHRSRVAGRDSPELPGPLPGQRHLGPQPKSALCRFAARPKWSSSATAMNN